MTARQRIEKQMREHDLAVEGFRTQIRELVGNPFPTAGEAHQAANRIQHLAGCILSRTAQRAESGRNLALLEYHVSKHPGATETFGI